MHLSEGVLSMPTLLVGATVATVGVVIGLRQMEYDKLPFVALFTAAFFVASTIHIPVGIGSVHLILNGLAGVFIGWAVFPAFLIALVLQILFFSFGGFSVLGINLCIMALPSVIVHYLLRHYLSRHSNTSNPSKKPFVFAGCLAGTIGILGSVLIASLVLAIDGGREYGDLIILLVITHIPVFITDSLISAGVLLSLTKMYPLALRNLR
ncbi:cobalt/nickel transport system permease protein [Nicoletella semolina]|uniref:Cobalt/nickel transport system permease protein n=1 Tax=Nicoletella semolina TaxID=271160 RepID=A0A4R2NBE3_9PAST|nr:cobalt transporter CbiM [Nicoletella semolina]MDH2924917.1 cobalamin biosynthesis protein CbiM [Nicoletella semolina]TCP18461.1 cobalt/nickel transport system permease protein [Nicoletella semolina]